MSPLNIILVIVLILSIIALICFALTTVVIDSYLSTSIEELDLIDIDYPREEGREQSAK